MAAFFGLHVGRTNACIAVCKVGNINQFYSGYWAVIIKHQPLIDVFCRTEKPMWLRMMQATV